MSLENAPEEIQLAVDLIYLLETNEVDPKTALAALEFVKKICWPNWPSLQRHQRFNHPTLSDSGI
ncbi:pleiotropic regulatory protein RsmS [Plesiomonas shigelloides subsp. oncorhynchi]|nr:pleiotropic regulatory protein RsmS [Plesiomonas shigelloides]